MANMNLDPSNQTSSNVMIRIPTSIFRHLFPEIEDLNDIQITTFSILHLINKNIDAGFEIWLTRLLDLPRTSWTNLLRQYVAIEVSMQQGSETRLYNAMKRAENVPDGVIPEWINEYKQEHTTIQLAHTDTTDTYNERTRRYQGQDKTEPQDTTG